MTYDIGDLARLTATFTMDGAAVDPSTVSLIVKAPDGTLTTKVYGTDAELERTATGVYRMDLTITQAGTYRYRWVSTGTGKAAEEGQFDVRSIRAI